MIYVTYIRVSWSFTCWQAERLAGDEDGVKGDAGIGIGMVRAGVTYK